MFSIILLLKTLINTSTFLMKKIILIILSFLLHPHLLPRRHITHHGIKIQSHKLSLCTPIKWNESENKEFWLGRVVVVKRDFGAFAKSLQSAADCPWITCKKKERSYKPDKKWELLSQTQSTSLSSSLHWSTSKILMSQMRKIDHYCLYSERERRWLGSRCGFALGSAAARWLSFAFSSLQLCASYPHSSGSLCENVKDHTKEKKKNTINEELALTCLDFFAGGRLAIDSWMRFFAIWRFFLEVEKTHLFR